MNLITNTDKVEKKKWSDFVSNHPHGNIFQTPEMYEVYKQTKNYEPLFFSVFNEKDEIIGSLLAVIQKEHSGILGHFSSRSIIWGGPLIKDDNINTLDLILKEYNSTIEQKAIYSQFRNFNDQNTSKSTFAKYNFTYENHLNIHLDLSVGEIELFDNFSKSRKKGIKKAQKEDFVFEVIENKEFIEKFYKLLSTSYSKIKLPFPKKAHFYKLIENLNPENFKIFSLGLNGESVISLFSLIYKDTLYGYYIGTKDDENLLRMKPTDLIFWNVFKWSMNNNIRTFDWMGAGKPDKDYGVRDFKLQYGGNLLNYGRYEKVHKPILYKLAKLSLFIWKILK
jgi:serine/alanine adding enzyme